jgi:hypothetical protein
MNDWERYHAQQASYNLIAIVLRPKVFLFFMLMGLVLQLSMEPEGATLKPKTANCKDLNES